MISAMDDLPGHIVWSQMLFFLGGLSLASLFWGVIFAIWTMRRERYSQIETVRTTSSWPVGQPLGEQYWPRNVMENKE